MERSVTRRRRVGVCPSAGNRPRRADRHPTAAANLPASTLLSHKGRGKKTHTSCQTSPPARALEGCPGIGFLARRGPWAKCARPDDRSGSAAGSAEKSVMAPKNRLRLGVDRIERLLRQRVLQFVGRGARSAVERGRTIDRDANVGEAVRSAAQLPQHEGQAMAQRQPVRRQFVLLHQLFERRRRSDRPAADTEPNCRAGAAAPRRNRALPDRSRPAFSSSTSASSHRPARLRHQPHAEEIAELQEWSSRASCRPAAAGAAVRRKRMRQDRFGLGVADAVGQAGKRIETVDGDLVARRDLRSQAGQPERIERAMPEGDDVRPHARRL